MNKFFEYLFLSRQPVNLDRFELYNTYSDAGEAYIIKGVLETNGIKCIIEGDSLSSVYPSLSFTGYRLLIKRADFIMADQLLSQIND